MRERVSGRARPWRPGAHLGGLRVPARRGSAAGLPGCPRPAGLRVLRCRPASLSLPHLGATLTGTPHCTPAPEAGPSPHLPPVRGRLPLDTPLSLPRDLFASPSSGLWSALSPPSPPNFSDPECSLLRRPDHAPPQWAAALGTLGRAQGTDTNQGSSCSTEPVSVAPRALRRGGGGDRGAVPGGAGCPGLVAAGKGDRAMWRGRRPRAGPEPRKAPQPEARITRGPCGDCVSGASQCNLGGSAASGEVVGPPPSREGRGSRCVRVSGSA